MGYFYAILCALCWSATVVGFKALETEHFSAAFLNFFKNLLGVMLFLGFVLLSSDSNIFYLSEFSWQENGYIYLSGVLGIGIADGLFLWGIKKTDAMSVAVLEYLYAPSVILLSLFFLNEWLQLNHLLGFLVITFALFILYEDDFRKYFSNTVKAKRTRSYSGEFLILSGVFLMAVGVILVKNLLPRADLQKVIFIRMFAGMIISGFVFFYFDKLSDSYKTFLTSKRKTLLFFISFIATFVTMLLWMAGFKYAEAGVVAILNQTSSFFTIALAWLFLGEPLTFRKITSVLVAFVGITIIFL